MKRVSILLDDKASVSFASTLGRHARKMSTSSAARTLGAVPTRTKDSRAVRSPVLVEGANIPLLRKRLLDGDPDCEAVALADGFLSALVDLPQAKTLLREEGLERVQTKKPKTLRLESALADMAAALPASSRPFEEDGLGVLIGVIDTGFDLSHPMFRDTSGALRVEGLLDQRNENLEYSREQLQHAWLTGACPGTDEDGHGTHVASIAGGSPFADRQGVAPRAGLLLVKTDFQNTDLAVNWIFRRAERLGRPCVVNMSLGHHLGAHDGTDAEERLMEKLVGPGRLIVVAAGNERTDRLHVGGRFHAGQLQTVPFEVLRQPDEPPHAVLTLWHDESDTFAISLTTPSGDSLPVPKMNQSDIYESGQIDVELARKRYAWSGLTQVQIALAFKNTEVSDRLIRDWALEIRCQAASLGRLDGWFNNSGFGRFGESPLVESARTVGLPATGDGCLAVASHASCAAWDSDLGPERDGRLVLGRSSPFSSLGPTRAGHWKPDVSAPGQYVTAALADRSRLASWDERSLAASRLVTIEGTSMAAPAVAGLVALLLQRRPTLTTAEARDVLRRSAARDAHTGPAAWDPTYGFGKVSAARALSLL